MFGATAALNFDPDVWIGPAEYSPQTSSVHFPRTIPRRIHPLLAITTRSKRQDLSRQLRVETANSRVKESRLKSPQATDPADFSAHGPLILCLPKL